MPNWGLGSCARVFILLQQPSFDWLDIINLSHSSVSALMVQLQKKLHSDGATMKEVV